jgi:hypothetical protein
MYATILRPSTWSVVTISLSFPYSVRVGPLDGALVEATWIAVAAECCRAGRDQWYRGLV